MLIILRRTQNSKSMIILDVNKDVIIGRMDRLDLHIVYSERAEMSLGTKGWPSRPPLTNSIRKCQLSLKSHVSCGNVDALYLELNKSLVRHF